MKASGILFLLLFSLLPTSLYANWNGVADEEEARQYCREHLQLHRFAGHQSLGVLREERALFDTLAEQALAYRATTIAVYEQLQAQIEEDSPLNGEQLHLLNDGMAEHLKLRQQLFDMAHRHECWLDLSTKETSALGMDEATRLHGIMLSLGSALVLFDNYLLAISIFEEDDKLRRLLNQDDKGYQIARDELTRVSRSYSSVTNRQRVRRAIEFYEMHYKRLNPEEQAKQAYLHQLIEQSPSYNMTKEWSPLFVLGNKLELLANVTADSLGALGRDGMNLFSMGFGNTVGLVETRKGKLHGDKAVQEEVEHQLKAGDILLEKTPFRLTDTLIPGHWGHAAIWIGTEKELKKLGIWDDPVVRPYQQAIRKGKGVVEALRSGVVMSPLKHFLNIDDLAVIRAPQLSEEERRTVITQALRQVGKDYDFNFDVETTDRIVCSELIYVSYTMLPWPTEKTLGRATISPDNIASRAVEGGILQPVLLYLDGKPRRERTAFYLSKLL